VQCAKKWQRCQPFLESVCTCSAKRASKTTTGASKGCVTCSKKECPLCKVAITTKRELRPSETFNRIGKFAVTLVSLLCPILEKADDGLAEQAMAQVQRQMAEVQNLQQLKHQRMFEMEEKPLSLKGHKNEELYNYQ